MSFSESILIALFCMAVVFSVLGILWAIIRLFSMVLGTIEQKQEAPSSSTNSNNQ